jgi:hypothetical protein
MGHQLATKSLCRGRCRQKGLLGWALRSMRPGGFEPPTHSLEGCCSIQLSYGRALTYDRCSWNSVNGSAKKVHLKVAG